MTPTHTTTLGADDPRRTPHLLLLLSISILIGLMMLALSLTCSAVVDAVAFDAGGARVTCVLNDNNAWKPELGGTAPADVAADLAAACTERLEPAFRLRGDLLPASVLVAVAGCTALVASARPAIPQRISAAAAGAWHWIVGQVNPQSERTTATPRDHSRGCVSVLNAAAFYFSIVRTGGIAQSPFFVLAAMVTTMQMNVGLRGPTKQRLFFGAVIFCLLAIIAEMADGSLEVSYHPVPLTVMYTLVLLVQVALVEPHTQASTASKVPTAGS